MYYISLKRILYSVYFADTSIFMYMLLNVCIYKCAFIICTGRRVTDCTEKLLGVNSLNYFPDFTQATLCYNITIMDHNISMFYLELASRLAGHIRGEA